MLTILILLVFYLNLYVYNYILIGCAMVISNVVFTCKNSNRTSIKESINSYISVGKRRVLNNDL